MPPDRDDDRGATVHGCCKWTERYGEVVRRATSRSATVHGLNLYFRFAKATNNSDSASVSLTEDILWWIILTDAGAAAKLAQCSWDMFHLARPATSRLVRLQETNARKLSMPNGRLWIQHVYPVYADGSEMRIICCGKDNLHIIESLSEPGNASIIVPTHSTMLPHGLGLSLPSAATMYGDLLLVANRAQHRVQLFRNRRTNSEGWLPERALEAATMRHPSAVATDGTHAFVCGADGAEMVHVFDLDTGACIMAWPLKTPALGKFKCQHGMALHRQELFLVDQSNAFVHVFNEEGTHLRSFGGYGSNPGRFRQPWGVTTCDDLVLVSEHGGKRVQVFTLEGEPVGHAAPLGCGALAGMWAGKAGADSEDVAVLVADRDQHCVRHFQLQKWYSLPSVEQQQHIAID